MFLFCFSLSFFKNRKMSTNIEMNTIIYEKCGRQDYRVKNLCDKVARMNKYILTINL